MKPHLMFNGHWFDFWPFSEKPRIPRQENFIKIPSRRQETAIFLFFSTQEQQRSPGRCAILGVRRCHLIKTSIYRLRLLRVSLCLRFLRGKKNKREKKPEKAVKPFRFFVVSAAFGERF